VGGEGCEGEGEGNEFSECTERWSHLNGGMRERTNEEFDGKFGRGREEKDVVLFIREFKS